MTSDLIPMKCGLSSVSMSVFCSWYDVRILSTITVLATFSGNSFLFRRYLEDDGLRGRDNAFLLLSFWYVEALILMNMT